MDLVVWLEAIQECQNEPECLDLDLLEDALDQLLDLSEANLGEYGQPQDGLEEGCRQTLLAMAAGLARFCECLDAFLDDLDFGHLARAWSEASELARRRDELWLQERRHGLGVF